MSSIGRTPNYDLPRFLRGSVPQWTGDVGPAFDKIDEVLFAQGGEIAGALNRVEQMNNNLLNGLERVAQAESVANEAKESADDTAGEVVHMKTDVNNLSTNIQNMNLQIEKNKTDIAANVGHISSLADEVHNFLSYKMISITSSDISVAANGEARVINRLSNLPRNYRPISFLEFGFSGPGSLDIWMSGWFFDSNTFDNYTVYGKNGTSTGKNARTTAKILLMKPFIATREYVEVEEEFPEKITVETTIEHRINGEWINTTGMSIEELEELYATSETHN